MSTRQNYLEPSSTNSSTPKQANRLYKPPTNNSIIVGHCQTDFQPLDPKLFIKSKDKSLLAEHKHLYSYSQSFQLSAYDSGFFDDQASDNLSTSTSTATVTSTKELRNNLSKKGKLEHRSIDAIFTKKNEDTEETVISLNDLSASDSTKSLRQKQRLANKRVSFQS